MRTQLTEDEIRAAVEADVQQYFEQAAQDERLPNRPAISNVLRLIRDLERQRDEAQEWRPMGTGDMKGEPVMIAEVRDGEVVGMDYDATLTQESESWEIPQPYWIWLSANGSVEEPTHWAPMLRVPPPRITNEDLAEADALSRVLGGFEGNVLTVRTGLTEEGAALLAKADTDKDLLQLLQHTVTERVTNGRTGSDSVVFPSDTHEPTS